MDIEKSIAALASFDWGADLGPLQPIDDAIVASHGDAAARAELEKTLVAELAKDHSRDAKDYVCRKLMAIGSAASVPTLAAMLGDANMSHMARYALERIPGAEAGQALRDALAKVAPELQVGVISSLGARQEDAGVEALAGQLSSSNAAVAKAAASALGAIRSAAAAEALGKATLADGAKSAAVDASMACAEAMLAHGNATGALAIYKKYAGGDQPKHVKLAATRGMLACSAKK
jgi:HEAT repeat protein